MKVLTFGYTGTQVASLAAALNGLPGALLVDVRLSPYSRETDWCAPALRRRFGARYLQVREFGNLNYKTHGPVQLADASMGVRRLFAATRASEPVLVLLCACRDRAGCHRDAVASLLVRQLGGVDAGELAPVIVASDQLALW